MTWGRSIAGVQWWVGLDSPRFFLNHITKAKESLCRFLLLFLTLHSFVPCLACNSINEWAREWMNEWMSKSTNIWGQNDSISYFLWLEQNGSHLPLLCALSSQWLIKKEKEKIPEVFNQIPQACPESLGAWAFRRGFLLIVTHGSLALVGSTPKPVSRMGAYLLPTWPYHLTEAFLWVWCGRKHKVSLKKDQTVSQLHDLYWCRGAEGRASKPAQKYVNTGISSATSWIPVQD